METCYCHVTTSHGSESQAWALFLAAENVAPLGWVSLNEMWGSVPSGEEVLEGVLSLVVSGNNGGPEYLRKCCLWSPLATIAV